MGRLWVSRAQLRACVFIQQQDIITLNICLCVTPEENRFLNSLVGSNTRCGKHIIHTNEYTNVLIVCNNYCKLRKIVFNTKLILNIFLACIHSKQNNKKKLSVYIYELLKKKSNFPSSFKFKSFFPRKFYRWGVLVRFVLKKKSEWIFAEWRKVIEIAVFFSKNFPDRALWSVQLILWRERKEVEISCNNLFIFKLI